MAIQSQVGGKLYKVSESDPCVVLVQLEHGAKWAVFWECRTPEDARELVLRLGKGEYKAED